MLNAALAGCDGSGRTSPTTTFVRHCYTLHTAASAGNNVNFMMTTASPKGRPRGTTRTSRSTRPSPSISRYTSSSLCVSPDLMLPIGWAEDEQEGFQLR
eukprot:763001-Hanusia_phi.AAC.6